MSTTEQLEQQLLDVLKSDNSQQTTYTNPYQFMQLTQGQKPANPYTYGNSQDSQIDQYMLQQLMSGKADPMFMQSSLKSLFAPTRSVSIIGLGLGVALASFFGGLFARFLPIGGLSVPIAGFVLRMVFKSGIMNDIATGVLVAGIGSLLGGLVGGLTGGLGGLLGGAGLSTQAATTSDIPAGAVA